MNNGEDISKTATTKKLIYKIRNKELEFLELLTRKEGLKNLTLPGYTEV